MDNFIADIDARFPLDDKVVRKMRVPESLVFRQMIEWRSWDVWSPAVWDVSFPQLRGR